MTKKGKKIAKLRQKVWNFDLGQGRPPPLPPPSCVPVMDHLLGFFSKPSQLTQQTTFASKLLITNPFFETAKFRK